MSHRIHGIITSFPYEGKLPHVVLVGNYHFLPSITRQTRRYREKVIEPYEEMTTIIRKTIKELSFQKKCIYIETDYFGGDGAQMSEVWEDGERIEGPYISFDGVQIPSELNEVTVVDDAINLALRAIGIYCHDELDEFDSVRLGWYRTNEEVLEEYDHKSKK